MRRTAAQEVIVLDDSDEDVQRQPPPRIAPRPTSQLPTIDLVADEADPVESGDGPSRAGASGAQAGGSAGDAREDGLVIDLSSTDDAVDPAAEPIDLTADDQTLARQMQRAFDSVDLTAHDRSDDDVLLPYRNSIDRFLSERAACLRVKEVFHNPHSQPGQPLYKRFLAAYKKSGEKSIRLVFHGTDEANVDNICRSSLDPRKRGTNGQALGRGEYFAEDVLISLPYCKGGRKLLVFAVLMDQAGLRKHNTPGVLVCHRPGHHIPIAVLTLLGTADRVLQSSGLASMIAQRGLPPVPTSMQFANPGGVAAWAAIANMANIMLPPMPFPATLASRMPSINGRMAPSQQATAPRKRPAPVVQAPPSSRARVTSQHGKQAKQAAAPRRRRPQ